MNARLSTVRGRTIRRLLAVTLGLWLGGVGCLIGCETNASAAPAADTLVSSLVATESCSTSARSGHDCCHQKTLAGRHESGKASSAGAVSHPSFPTCCPLAGQKANAARKSNLVDAAPTVHGFATVTTHQIITTQRPPSAARRVPDRGSTYLRCCVFLI